MSMTTQCPSCSTTFRVTPQQLQSQQGMVRCGRCATVFDGFKSLATLPEEVRAEPARNMVAAAAPEITDPAPAAAPVADENLPVAAETATREIEADAAGDGAEVPFAQSDADERMTAENAAEQEPATSSAPADDFAEAPASSGEINDRPAADATPAPEPVVIADVPAAAANQTSAPQPIAINDAYLQTPPPVPPARRSALWAIASLLLVLALGAQWAYLYRGEIAASVPEARPLLSDLCKSIGCTVALPQRPRQISIEASDMQAADAVNSGLIVLTATLRNQATITLGYPALDVVLTNTRDHTVARRIFLPNEYLADARESRAGIAPSAEVTIRLNIDSGDLGAAGFRLELMAAPAG
jgi:predicted Zn finger-like uncharacterized protein